MAGGAIEHKASSTAFRRIDLITGWPGSGLAEDSEHVPKTASGRLEPIAPAVDVDAARSFRSHGQS